MPKSLRNPLANNHLSQKKPNWKMNERENGEHACQGVPFIPLITLFFYSRFLCIPFINHLSVILSLSLSRTHDGKRTLFVPRPDPYVLLVRIRHFLPVVCVLCEIRLCSQIKLSPLLSYVQLSRSHRWLEIVLQMMVKTQNNYSR